MVKSLQLVKKEILSRRKILDSEVDNSVDNRNIGLSCQNVFKLIRVLLYLFQM